MIHELPSRLVSKLAYDIEAQALVVQDAQSKGELTRIDYSFLNKGIEAEWGQNWLLINDSNSVFFEPHCDMESFQELKNGHMITKIYHPQKLKIFNFGTQKSAVAALLSGSSLIYLSPGFDILAFLSRQKDIDNTITLSPRSKDRLEYWFAP